MFSTAERYNREWAGRDKVDGPIRMLSPLNVAHDPTPNFRLPPPPDDLRQAVVGGVAVERRRDREVRADALAVLVPGGTRARSLLHSPPPPGPAGGVALAGLGGRGETTRRARWRRWTDDEETARRACDAVRAKGNCERAKPARRACRRWASEGEQRATTRRTSRRARRLRREARTRPRRAGGGTRA